MEACEQEILYGAHLAIVHKMVWTACRRFPNVPYDEILSAAHEIFCLCCKKWETDNGSKFSTYLMNALKKTFLNLNWWYKAPLPSIMNPEWVGVNGMCGPERLLRLKQALEQMGPMAVEIINLVFSPPPALGLVMEEKGKSIPTKEVLRSYLRNVGIGEADVITEAFCEITQTLEEV
jgi:hypothetical protein